MVNIRHIEPPCVHERMVDGKLDLFLCLLNDCEDVPFDWYASDEYMELHVHFSINEIFESMYEFMRCPSKEGDVILNEDKPKFDALKKQLESTLQKVNALTFMEENQWKLLNGRD